MAPRTTDATLARLAGEIEQQQTFQDGLLEDAEAAGRDLTENELELFERSRDRLRSLNAQLGPLQESRRISVEASTMLAEIARVAEQDAGRDPNRPVAVEYRSAGAYVLDYWRAGLGVSEASERLELYHRAAAHQTTADNPGLLPEQILGPVIDFVDRARPLTTALGPRQLPSGSWSRPRVTQHTNVAPQASGEKTELVSRKMLIEKVPVAATTYGGYVNVSRQDIDWTQPSIMDLIISDLSGVYAEETEKALCADLVAAATPGTAVVPDPPTALGIAAAIWEAAGLAYAATKGAGSMILALAPDMLGLVGPIFPPVNPQSAFSGGFSAAAFGSGAQGSIAGITAVVSPGLASGNMLAFSTAAVEVYEDRIGSLQVVEPSVLGVQVAYAGYFADLIVEEDAIIAIQGAA